MKLSDAGFRPLPTVIPHEWVEEEKESVLSEYVTTIQIRKNSLNLDPSFRYFVDGTLRSSTIGFCDLGTIKIPIIAANIAVGAGEIRNGVVTPCHNFILYATILLLPETAISNYYIPNFRLPIGSDLRLDHKGDFINKVQIGVPSNPLGNFLLCDTTYDFAHRLKIDDHNLTAPGYVQSRALNALSGILRTFEVGLVGKMRVQKDEFIVFDGPLVRRMFLNYGRLADKNLQGIEHLTDPIRTFDFLRRVIGVVKRVVVIPEDRRFQEVFRNDDYFYIPVFRNLQVDPQEGPEPHLLSCFVYLRPEIARVFPSRPDEGLIRIDIPLPAILDKYEPDWHIKSNLTLSSQEKSRLEGILKTLLSLRKPLPHTTERYKMFSELYPINQIEAYLKSRLIPYPELRVKILQELRNRGLL
jgi:ethanolamine utilization microcompartment shell protein EutS